MEILSSEKPSFLVDCVKCQFDHIECPFFCFSIVMLTCLLKLTYLPHGISIICTIKEYSTRGFDDFDPNSYNTKLMNWSWGFNGIGPET